MSAETLVVVLGERRYGVHRGWASLPAGKALGFVSDLAVDQSANLRYGWSAAAQARDAARTAPPMSVAVDDEDAAVGGRRDAVHVGDLIAAPGPEERALRVEHQDRGIAALADLQVLHLRI